MYEDDKPWPITCPGCGQHFRQQVGWLKVRDAIRCPACGLLYKYSREKLSLQIAEAREVSMTPCGTSTALRRLPSSRRAASRGASFMTRPNRVLSGPPP
jgi:uncharacterized C2H2 Zn-finger protein